MTEAPTSSVINRLQNVAHFDYVDYGIFFVMLGISVAIGLYFGFFEKKAKTVEEYLLGGKSMSPLPIAFSLIAGGISGITLIGVPAEVYSEGPSYVLVMPSAIIASIFAKYFFLPIYYDLKVPNIYEYLELRFNKRVRKLTSFFYNASYLLYLPAVIYVPSLSLSQATGINLHVISSIMTIICVFYTMIGGIKAVVWTDFLQLLSLLIAIFAIMIIGTYNVGGVTNVFHLASKGEKLDIFNFDPSPFQRQSFWICFFGPIIQFMINYGCSQATVQRFLSLRSERDTNFVLVVYVLGYMMITGISIYNGLLIYGTYFGCDPVENKFIDRGDQIFPYYVLDKMGSIPGLSGIFLAGVVSAALSSLSTGFNTCAGVIYEDFIRRDSISDKWARFIMKMMIIGFGIFCLFAVLIFENLGKILSVSYGIVGTVDAPLGVIFFLGMFCPWANSIGVISGALTCVFLVGWITTGANISKINFGSTQIYPEEFNSCPNSTASFVSSHQPFNVTDVEDDGVFLLYKISFMLYYAVGITSGVIVGLIVSFITGANDPSEIDPRLICPPLRRFLPKKKIASNLSEYKNLMVNKVTD